MNELQDQNIYTDIYLEEKCVEIDKDSIEENSTFKRIQRRKAYCKFTFEEIKEKVFPTHVEEFIELRVHSDKDKTNKNKSLLFSKEEDDSLIEAVKEFDVKWNLILECPKYQSILGKRSYNSIRKRFDILKKSVGFKLETFKDKRDKAIEKGLSYCKGIYGLTLPHEVKECKSPTSCICIQ